ncbi:DMT family transporter [Roseicella aquatilis]|uniref:DMT family transporter n=1 Tax=Roseicella aquatilis TaxID=2527868 RepID=A0A4V2WM18_9PROT|nr:DMT family transporter [Roseicella aquatilis]TCZ65942.1 DMT family transporter [Roseicella aquatilis]
MTSSRALAGLGLMLAATTAFAAMGACFRLAIQDGLPLPLLPFARGAFTLLLLLPWLLRQGPSALATRRPGAHVLRCAAGFASFLLYLLAIAWMPLADAVAIMQAKPLWALPLAVLLLGERLRTDRVLAALLGFAGVLVIARPDGDLSPGALAAVGSGITGALVMIAMKRMAGTEPAMRVVAWYGISAVLAWGPVSALVWDSPSALALACLLAGSALAVAGDLLMQAASRRAEIGLLAPVDYVGIPITAGLGMLLFDQRPGWALVFGTLLMLAATLWIARGARRG